MEGEYSKLAIARYRKGLSQQQVAEAVGITRSTLSQWERGVQVPQEFYVQRLCDFYQMARAELGLDGLARYRPRKIASKGKQDRSLSLASDSTKTGTSILREPQQELDKEIDRLITRRLTRLQDWVVDGLEDGTQLRWQLYYTSRNSLTENGLLSQITRLEQLADNGGEQHQRICRILAQNYQLAGSVARDRFQYTKALEFFQKAEKLHEDIQIPDLTATAIARQAIALLRKDPERYLNRSLTLYSSALDTVKYAEPYTQAYVFSHNAEALARKGDYDGCIRSLDQAETLLKRAANIPIEEDFAYVHPSLQSLADSRGECYVLLGKPEKGLEHLQAAQKRLNQKMNRNNCRLLMLQAEAYLAASQPDASVQQALKGLEVARTLESTSNIHWADEILAKLRSSAFRNEPIVDELDEAIRG